MISPNNELLPTGRTNQIHILPPQSRPNR
jgi:hypothetical protein